MVGNVQRKRERTVAQTRARVVELRRLSYELAGRTGLDPRTCRGALERGASALRAIADQELVASAADELGIVLPLP